jgi:uncharacterized protein YjiS (DUF1127 family)
MSAPSLCSSPQRTGRQLASQSLPQACRSSAELSRTHRCWHLLRDGTGFLGRLIDAWFNWYGCRHDAVRQRRDLLRLSDDMLKDVGLTRADIEGEFAKGFWRQ